MPKYGRLHTASPARPGPISSAAFERSFGSPMSSIPTGRAARHGIPPGHLWCKPLRGINDSRPDWLSFTTGAPLGASGLKKRRQRLRSSAPGWMKGVCAHDPAMCCAVFRSYGMRRAKRSRLGRRPSSPSSRSKLLQNGTNGVISVRACGARRRLTAPCGKIPIPSMRDRMLRLGWPQARFGSREFIFALQPQF